MDPDTITSCPTRLLRLVSEGLAALETGVFYPNPRWHCKGMPVPEPVPGVGVRRPRGSSRALISQEP